MMHATRGLDQNMRIAARGVSEEDRLLVAAASGYFADGAEIWTEHSHKYTVPDFVRTAGKAGFRLQQVWTDPRQFFAVLDFAGART